MATSGQSNVGRVIVTRPAQDAAGWVEQLQSQGVNALALPLIEIAAASSKADVLALQTARQNLANYAACMFVSGNAVEHFFKHFSHHLVPFAQLNRAQADPEIIANSLLQSQTRTRFLAPGPGTALALRTAGVPADLIDCPPPDAAQFDSAALWAVVGLRDWRGARVLLVRGHTDEPPGSADALHAALTDAAPPRDWLTQKWLAAGAQVDVVNVYERRAPGLTPEQLDLARAAACDGSVWLFSSSEAVLNLVGNESLAGNDWSAARAIATHPRIVQTVQAAGWGAVAASRPSLPEIVQVWRSIESSLS